MQNPYDTKPDLPRQPLATSADLEVQSSSIPFDPKSDPKFDSKLNSITPILPFLESQLRHDVSPIEPLFFHIDLQYEAMRFPGLVNLYKESQHRPGSLEESHFKRLSLLNGTPWWGWVAESQQNQIRTQWQESVSKRSHFIAEFELNHPDLPKAVMMQALPLPTLPAKVGHLNEDSDSSDYLATWIDIDQRLARESQLIHHERRFQRLVDTMTDGLIIEGGDGRIAYLNPKMAHMLGGEKPEEFINSLIEEWLTKSSRKTLKEQNRLRQAGHTESYPLTWKLKGGQTWDSMMTPQIIRDAAGECIGSFALVTDLDQHTRSEHERNLRLAAEAADRTKSALLSGVSHRLRTPLTAILGFSELLKTHQSCNLNVTQLEYLRHIHESAAQLSRTLQEVLDYSAHEASPKRFQTCKILLKPLLDNCIALHTPTIQKKEIHLHMQVDPELLIYTDPDALHECISNMIGHAAEHTPFGGKLGVRISQWLHDTLFEVWDTGPELDKKVMQMIASGEDSSEEEQWYKTPSRAHSLGLVLAKRLVLAQRGDIWVENRSPNGVSFFFSIPNLKDLPEPSKGLGSQTAQNHNALRASGIARAYKGTSGASDSDAFPRRHALLVEDDAVNRKLTSHVLTREGWSITEATCGVEAVDLATNKAPDVILLDVGLPDIDGLEVLRRLQACCPHDTPIIAMTGFAAQSDLRTFATAGFTGCITKPIQTQSLVYDIEDIIKHARSGKDGEDTGYDSSTKHDAKTHPKTGRSNGHTSDHAGGGGAKNDSSFS